jgi:hypothetical protein
MFMSLPAKQEPKGTRTPQTELSLSPLYLKHHARKEKRKKKLKKNMPKR